MRVLPGDLLDCSLETLHGHDMETFVICHRDFEKLRNEIEAKRIDSDRYADLMSKT